MSPPVSVLVSRCFSVNGSTSKQDSLFFINAHKYTQACIMKEGRVTQAAADVHTDPTLQGVTSFT